ncbi:hypothetical protein QUA54_09360 [Microcoleus sp. MOSTC5]|uniref:hypothetical protein n=1 Tax=Microcoleus sp. MOSTC5 TaxID=3055378 RepID=UPI002FD5884F
MKPDTHHCFSISTPMRSSNRVMLGFTLPSDSQALTWQAQLNLGQRAIALEDMRKNSAFPPENT